MSSFCVQAHSQTGLGYPWLDQIHDGVDFIIYEEPVGSGNWKSYTNQVWEAHCRVVSHNPQDLVQAHVDAFINPSTRFARLMFVFKDNTHMEPIPYFYQLEAQWFATYTNSTYCGQGGKCACGTGCKCGPECNC